MCRLPTSPPGADPQSLGPCSCCVVSLRFDACPAMGACEATRPCMCHVCQFDSHRLLASKNTRAHSYCTTKIFAIVPFSPRFHISNLSPQLPPPDFILTYFVLEHASYHTSLHLKQDLNSKLILVTSRVVLSVRKYFGMSCDYYQCAVGQNNINMTIVICNY